jgi:class 3 adenylate cyclase
MPTGAAVNDSQQTPRRAAAHRRNALPLFRPTPLRLSDAYLRVKIRVIAQGTKTTGDGLLVEFAGVVDAVRCAVEVQREMILRNAAAPAEGRIEVRMGGNLGDITIEDGDIFGDGVNIAARLEALAAPGGICLSAAAHEQVRDRLDLAFDDLGEQQVKNISRPVHAFAIRLTRTAGLRPACGRDARAPAHAAAASPQAVARGVAVSTSRATRSRNISSMAWSRRSRRRSRAAWLFVGGAEMNHTAPKTLLALITLLRALETLGSTTPMPEPSQIKSGQALSRPIKGDQGGGDASVICEYGSASGKGCRQLKSLSMRGDALVIC